MFENGGVEENLEKAFEYFQKSAEKGFSLGFFKIGYYYRNGWFVKKDIQKAIQNYEISAKMGNKDAFYRLGLIYWKEEGFKDFEKSANCFFQSSLREGEYSKKRLIELLSEKKVEWKKEFHQFWKSSPLLIERRNCLKEQEKREIGLNEQIMTILLISKKRRTSKQDISFFVHGIAINVIKFLCHSCQLIKGEGNEEEEEEEE